MRAGLHMHHIMRGLDETRQRQAHKLNRIACRVIEGLDPDAVVMEAPQQRGRMTHRQPSRGGGYILLCRSIYY